MAKILSFGEKEFPKTSVVFDTRDEATPYLAWLSKEFPVEMRKALKSLGWVVRKEIVQGMERQAPAGHPYPPLSPLQKTGLLGAIKTVKRRKKTLKYATGSRFADYGMARPGKQRTKPFEKLIKAVRYKYDDVPQAVTIGWVTPSAKYYGKLQGGWRGAKYNFREGPQRVTGKMRRLFFAAGIHLKKGKLLRTPKRPVIDPVFKKIEPKIPDYIEKKISKWLARSLGRSIRYHSAKLAMGRTAAFRRYVRYAA